MTILPKVLYLLRTLPIKVPQSFFGSLQALQMRFIWAHKTPRIKFILLRPKALGGIPDFKTYYHATQNSGLALPRWPERLSVFGKRREPDPLTLLTMDTET